MLNRDTSFSIRRISRTCNHSSRALRWLSLLESFYIFPIGWFSAWHNQSRSRHSRRSRCLSRCLRSSSTFPRRLTTLNTGCNCSIRWSCSLWRWALSTSTGIITRPSSNRIISIRIRQDKYSVYCDMRLQLINYFTWLNECSIRITSSVDSPSLNPISRQNRFRRVRLTIENTCRNEFSVSRPSSTFWFRIRRTVDHAPSWQNNTI